MTEPAYRKAHNLGDGVLGGAGLGNEYVLVDVKVTPAKESISVAPSTDGTTRDDSSVTRTDSSSTSTPSSGSSISDSMAASLCADQGVAYRLTGSQEPRLKTLVGRQVEIQGRFHHASAQTSSQTMTDTASKSKLPEEVEIVSYHEASGTPMAVTPSTDSPRVSPPTSTYQPAREPQTPPQPTPQTTPRQTTPQTTDRDDRLPRTASPIPLVGLIGLLAVGASLSLAALRRRRAL